MGKGNRKGMTTSRTAARKGLIHGIANCTECDWQCQDYLTVERQAAKHARITGHRVGAELGYAVTYSTNKSERLKKGPQ